MSCPFGYSASSALQEALPSWHPTPKDSTDPSTLENDISAFKSSLTADSTPPSTFSIPSLKDAFSTASLKQALPSPSSTSSQPASQDSAYTRRLGHEKLYYPSYLHLDALLSCQHPVSGEQGSSSFVHDELLFITIHQTYELWFKQILFELDSVRAIFAELSIGEKKIGLALHRLLRILEVQKILVDQIRILETMTPHEFLEFRDFLFPASGFQSFQFRLLEIKLGVAQDSRPSKKWMNDLTDKHRAIVEQAMSEPSLFDYVERWLRNIPFRNFRGYSFVESYKEAANQLIQSDLRVIEERLDGDDKLAALAELKKMKYTYESVYNREVHDEVVKQGQRRLGYRATLSALMITLYQKEPMLQLPARLLRVLVDVDDHLNQWRYRHAQMVHRMIGVKMGTGGSLGFNYLKMTVDRCKVFSDLANMSTLLIPSRFLPKLPGYVREQLQYFHTVEQYDRTLFESGGGGESIDWSFC